MKHICSICNKRVAKQYQKSHLRYHVRNPKNDIVLRASLWLTHKQELKKH